MEKKDPIENGMIHFENTISVQNNIKIRVH